MWGVVIRYAVYKFGFVVLRDKYYTQNRPYFMQGCLGMAYSQYPVAYICNKTCTPYLYYTVEPPNKGHFGDTAFVLISEVV